MSQGWALSLLELSASTELGESHHCLKRVLGFVPVAEASPQEPGLLACQNQTITASFDSSFFCPSALQDDRRLDSATREAAVCPRCEALGCWTVVGRPRATKQIVFSLVKSHRRVPWGEGTWHKLGLPSGG